MKQGQNVIFLDPLMTLTDADISRIWPEAYGKPKKERASDLESLDRLWDISEYLDPSEDEEREHNYPWFPSANYGLHSRQNRGRN